MDNNTTTKVAAAALLAAGALALTGCSTDKSEETPAGGTTSSSSAPTKATTPPKGATLPAEGVAIRLNSALANKYGIDALSDTDEMICQQMEVKVGATSTCKGNVWDEETTIKVTVVKVLQESPWVDFEWDSQAPIVPGPARGDAPGECGSYDNPCDAPEDLTDPDADCADGGCEPPVGYDPADPATW